MMHRTTTAAQATAAAAIAARMAAIAPADHRDDPATPAGAAIADMRAIARGEWDDQDADDAAAMIRAAADATAEYTQDGWSDPEAERAAEFAGA